MGTSRLGGVPTVLPPPDRRPPPGQLGLDLVGPDAVAAPAHCEVLPDVVHVAGWLDVDRQRALVDDFRRWAVPPAGLRHPRVPAGHLMTVQSVCLGWHWQPYAYSRTADDTDGAPVKPLPADAGRARPPGRRRHVRRTAGRAATRPTRRSSTCTPRAPDSACTRTARSRRTPRSSRSASATRACSAWPASTGAPARSPTSSCARATCSCSAAPTDASTTACRRCSTAPGPHDLGLPPGRLSITVRETGL